MALPPSESSSPNLLPEWLTLVREKVAQLRFGIVHDGRVTQIECTEKTRLPTPRDISSCP